VLPEIFVTTESIVKRNDWLAIDARQDDAYATAHIPGALQLGRTADRPWQQVDDLRAALSQAGLTGRERLLLYGNARSRQRLGRLFWLLEWAGFAEPKVLSGGFEAWLAAGQPVASGRELRPPQNFVSGAHLETTVDVVWLRHSFGEAGIELLDLRDRTDWTTSDYEVPPAFGDGHVPHSLPFVFSTLLTQADGWPEPAEVRRRLRALGPRPGDRVDLDSTFVLIGRDGSDPEPGLGYLLLRSAGIEVRILGGGWQAWISDRTLPVVRVVNAAELRELIEVGNPDLDHDSAPGLLLFDGRSEAAFARGHLPGAISLPAHRFAAGIERMIAERGEDLDPQSATLVFYCYGRDCVRSRTSSTIAARYGFRKLLWFRDGEIAWREAGYPFFASTVASGNPP